MKKILLAVALLAIGALEAGAQDSVLIIDGKSCDRTCMDSQCTPKGGEAASDLVRVPGGARIKSCSLSKCCG